MHTRTRISPRLDTVRAGEHQHGVRRDCGGVTAILPESDRIESEKEHRSKKRMPMTKSTEWNTMETISADNQVGAALQTTAEHFRMLVDNMKDYAIIILDTDGRVASWNPGSETILGYRSEEIIGQHFSRFYSIEDVQRGKPEMELKVATAEGRSEDEGWRIKKDGARFWSNEVI